MNIDQVMPYGFMAHSFERHLKLAHAPMAWNRSGLGYFTWLDQITKQLATDFWPEWNGTKWIGPSNGSALNMTFADLALMGKFSASKFGSPSRHSKGTKANSVWWRDEDDLFDSLSARFAEYFNTKLSNMKTVATSFAVVACREYMGATAFALKDRLQRPRAYQMAHSLGVSGAPLCSSTSAWSPSAISGHSFQALLGCLRIHIDHINTLSQSEQRDLQALAVDIGDRRVMAGIHFPTDNMMSWIVVLSMLQHLARDPNEEKVMVEFVANAIEGSELLAIASDTMGQWTSHVNQAISDARKRVI